MTSFFRLSVSLLAAAGLVGACSSFSGDNEDAPSAASDAGPELDPNEHDSGGDSSLDAGGPEASQPHATVMVKVPTKDGGSYAIDAYETTVAEFEQVTASHPWATMSSPVPPFCATKSDWGSRSGCKDLTTVAPDEPVNCVDWCDAFAFCAAVGKRLCGKIGGGPLDTTTADAMNIDKGEWTRACRGPSDTDFPYGDKFQANACNDGLKSAPVDVGTLTTCEGGYPGIFDMSGNIAEWENDCTSTLCYVRGGAYRYKSDDTGCLQHHTAIAISSYDDIGIRCCKD